MQDEKDKQITKLSEEVLYYKNLSTCLSHWRMEEAISHGEQLVTFLEEKQKLQTLIIQEKLEKEAAQKLHNLNPFELWNLYCKFLWEQKLKIEEEERNRRNG